MEPKKACILLTNREKGIKFFYDKYVEHNTELVFFLKENRIVSVKKDSIQTVLWDMNLITEEEKK